MFLLPPRLRRIFEHKRRKERRIFSDSTGLVIIVNASAWDSLSFREQEVVALLCMMGRNYEISKTLAISIPTVKTHLQNIFRKLNVRSTREIRLLLKDWPAREWWDDQHP